MSAPPPATARLFPNLAGLGVGGAAVPSLDGRLTREDRRATTARPREFSREVRLCKLAHFAALLCFQITQCRNGTVGNMYPSLSSLRLPSAVGACDKDSAAAERLSGLRYLTADGKEPPHAVKYYTQADERGLRAQEPVLCSRSGVPTCLVADAVFHVKGWGGGMTPGDFGDARLPVPGEMRAFADSDEVQGAIGAMAGGAPSPFWRLAPPRVLIQWDGDKIWDSEAKAYKTFGIFIPAVVKYLVDNGCTICGFLCQKLTTKDKYVEYAEDYMRTRGGQQLADYCADSLKINVPMYFVAFCTAEDPEVKRLQKTSAYGFLGSALNKAWPCGMPRRVFAFGGGGVLDAEEAWGYAEPETDIAAFNIPRKNGERSEFAKRHAAEESK